MREHADLTRGQATDQPERCQAQRRTELVSRELYPRYSVRNSDVIDVSCSVIAASADCSVASVSNDASPVRTRDSSALTTLVCRFVASA